MQSQSTSLAFWSASKVQGLEYVYFIQEGDDGPVKIGKAAEPGKRCTMLQCGNPTRLHIREVVASTWAYPLEYRLHCRFAELRLRGEWFDNTTGLVLTFAEAVGQFQRDQYDGGSALPHVDGLDEKWAEDSPYYKVMTLWGRHGSSLEGIASELEMDLNDVHEIVRRSVDQAPTYDEKWEALEDAWTERA